MERLIYFEGALGKSQRQLRAGIAGEDLGNLQPQGGFDFRLVAQLTGIEQVDGLFHRICHQEPVLATLVGI